MRTAGRARAAAAGANRPIPVGISAGEWITKLSSVGSPSAMDDYLDDAVVAVGAKWVREAVVWPTIQPTNSSTFDWGPWDAFTTKCAARGLSICAVIGGSPAWARPGAGAGLSVSAPPDDPATFGTFCAVAAARYPQIKVWEVGNEPNQPAYWGGTTGTPNDSDPAEYTAVLAAAYGAFKTADPSCTVLGGSFTPTLSGAGPDGQYYSPPDFLSGMLAAGAGAYMDAVSHHPYSYPEMPTTYHALNAWSQMEETTPSLRSILTGYGLGSMKIWITEYGAPTYGVGSSGTTWVTEAVQAAEIDEALRIARGNPNLYGGFFVFTGADRAAAGVDTDREKHFGVVYQATGYALKPGGTAMIAAINDTGGPG